MPETSPGAPQAISDLTGTWTLDPRRAEIQFHTKAMWVLPVSGTLRVTEGSGVVGGDGRVTGCLVVDANSIDTKNKRRDEHLRARTSSRSRITRASSSTSPEPDWAPPDRARWRAPSPSVA